MLVFRETLSGKISNGNVVYPYMLKDNEMIEDKAVLVYSKALTVHPEAMRNTTAASIKINSVCTDIQIGNVSNKVISL
jgi:hypothetical protein